MTGQIPKDQPPPSGLEGIPENREPTQPPTQVSNVTVIDKSSSQQQQLPPLSPPPKSPTAVTPPPVSPKPVGLNGFKLPRKQIKRAESLKTGAEIQKEKIVSKTKADKKIKLNSGHVSLNKNVEPEQVVTTAANPVKAAPKPFVPLSKKTSGNKSDKPRVILEDGDEGASLSPDLPGEEAPPPPDNIAFMITNTKVQALSCGEYQELVSAKKGSVQTVTVGSAGNKPNDSADPTLPQDNGFNKKPVIIIFNEPMDIRSAYKRLSTIFECEEELEKMLAEESIQEESEESDNERSGGLPVKGRGAELADGEMVSSSQSTADTTRSSSSSTSSISELTDSGVNAESNGDARQDKKKFKFKFPKKQLSALTQAIRTSTKSGKKTLQVVVYEDEEECDGTVRHHKEAKRFEIARSKSFAETSKGSESTTQKWQNSDNACRTDEIRKSTYKTLDSLEQTIKQLETTISEMGPCSPDELVNTEDSKASNRKSSEGIGLKRSSSLPSSRTSKVVSKSSLQKKTKPQLLPRPKVLPSTNTNTTTALSVPSNIQQVSL